jgi:hypothetical protein
VFSLPTTAEGALKVDLIGRCTLFSFQKGNNPEKKGEKPSRQNLKDPELRGEPASDRQILNRRGRTPPIFCL